MIFLKKKVVLLSPFIEFYHIVQKSVSNTNKDSMQSYHRQYKMFLFGIHKLGCFRLNSVYSQPKAGFPPVSEVIEFFFSNICLLNLSSNKGQ